MSWLSGAAAWLLRIILPIFINYWVKKVDAEIERSRRESEIKKEVEALRKKLEAAETEIEREKATDDLAKKSF
jgi:hypothetical protein